MLLRWTGFLISLWLILTLNFLLPRCLPGDPLSALIDPESSDYVFNAEVRTSLEAYYGLDHSLLAQYSFYWSDLLQGDLGQSIRLNRPVHYLIQKHLPWTLLLTLTSLFCASLLSLLMGSEAAWQRGKWMDHLLVSLSVLSGNAPVFFTGTILLIIFSVELEWLPLAGGRTAFAEYDHLFEEVVDYGTHLILPAATLTLALLGGQFLLVRNSMIGVLAEDYLLVARAKGLSRYRLKWHHGVRNAILPFIHHVAAHASFAFSGALFIETLFNYPGTGKLIYESVAARDYPVIQGVFVVISICVLIANRVADSLSYILDPRLREDAS